MFQAIWNVAAGFSLHEENTRLLSSQHFGHHQTELCENDQGSQLNSHIDNSHIDNSGHVEKITAVDQVQSTKVLDDHHDHLPSFSYFIVAECAITQHWPDPVYDPHLGDVVWNNLYQSPHLASLTPPPELTSL